MANRSYMSGPHRLLPGYTSLAVSRAGVGTGSNSRTSPPEFSYDAFPRSASGVGGSRDGTAYNRAPPSPASTALSLAYPNVSEFPYGLSGVQMPTYNFGSELYNYVSNGFPRKSRMCTFCNKVFTRSTTRRYHERRCPLLRASNSLAKSEENSTVAAAAAALKEQQQRHKDATSAISNPPPSAPRTSSSISNASSSQAGSTLPSAPTPASPPPPSLHPAYPTSFPPTSALGSSPSRSAAAAYNYAHSYGSHFYNSISAAALASLDQNSNTLQSKKESDNGSWTSSPSPSSKARDHSSSSILGSTSSLPKAFTNESGVDLTARYCADFSIRSQPPVFPPTSLREAPRSPPSPEPGETKCDSSAINDRRNSTSPQDFTRTSGREREWSSPNREKLEYPDKITVANLSGARLKVPSSSSPPPLLWNNKARMERAQEQYMVVQPVDDEEEDEDDEEEDEEEVEEDEEQFNENATLHSEGDDDDKKTRENGVRVGFTKSSAYNPLVCQFCKKSFDDTITRQAHEALHSQTKSFGCSLCSRAFHCAYSLRIHFLRHHNEGPFKCKQCPEVFDEIMVLKSHLLSQHTLPKQETCSLKYFSLLDNSDCSASRPHSAVSDSEQDIQEKNCQSQRRSADSLPDVLKDSDQTTKSLRTNELKDSMINGSLSDEETEICKVCNKSFARSVIRFHERAHADQKPYECPICNKRFGYKNNMKSHMKLHQGLKPYQCQICGARFTRGSTLRRHGRRHNISRNSMLDYVLYDHSAGPTRAVGVNKTVAAATTHATAVANSQYAQHNRMAAADQQIAKSLSYLPHGRTALPTTTTSMENDRYGSTAGRPTPPRTSPIGLASPRASSTHLTTQAMAPPMVGGLAAAAAANLFGYPTAVAAPHLYQFYASTNQLMSYSAYASNHGSQAVQSDALNLSLGKRKSPFEDEDMKMREKPLRRDSTSYDRSSPTNKSVYGIQEKIIKVEAQEPGEMTKREDPNPFSPNFSPQKERTQDIPHENKSVAYNSKESLEVSTEDFAAQVNICCPSPLVQSSTTPMHQTATGSPVGSSSCNDTNVQAHASPSGISHHSSPANSANSVPSPSNMSENHLQELLLSLLTSGRMFRCSFCDIYFTEYAMFRLHQKYHQCDTARPFLCSVCGEDCKDKTYFTVHLSEHLGLGTKAGLA